MICQSCRSRLPYFAAQRFTLNSYQCEKGRFLPFPLGSLMTSKKASFEKDKKLVSIGRFPYAFFLLHKLS